MRKIIKGVRNKDPLQEKKLYQILYENLFKIALAYCSDKEEATSVFNYAAVDIFEQLKDFHSQEELLRWAATILKFDCIDHVRKKAVYKNKLLAIPTNPDAHKVENEALSSLYMEELFEYLNTLKPAYRLCFVMYVLEGYTHKEIAEQLNINQNTSKWYLAEAKKELKIVISNSRNAIQKRN